MVDLRSIIAERFAVVRSWRAELWHCRPKDSTGCEREVSLFVRDTGSWRPPRGHNRGRGTLLMQSLMDEFEVTTGEAGTEVRMSKRLAGSLAA